MLSLTVRKRDGREMPFNSEKITSAVTKALQATGEASLVKGHSERTNLLLASDPISTVALEITRNVKKALAALNKESHDIEEIQDAVEKALVKKELALTAKHFILYRAERTRVRELDSRLMHTLRDITFSDAETSDLKRENANIDGDTAMGTMLKYGSEGAKHFYLTSMLNPTHADAHKRGDIHIHDLDFYSLTMTCCQIDLLSLLKGGFNTGHGHLREPNDIRSFAALAAIAIQSNQNDQHGGQSVPNFDYAMAEGVKVTYRKAYRTNLTKALLVLAPECAFDVHVIVEENTKALQALGLFPSLEWNTSYAEKEEETLGAIIGQDIVLKAQKIARQWAYQETDNATYQAMEAFIHNLNSMHSRAGAQVPFSSINYGMCTSPEGRLAIRNLLLSTEKGLGSGETAIFPIQIFRVKEGTSLNPGDPNYDLFKLACRVSAKRLFPNFSFQDAPFNKQYYKEGHPETEIAYMGCRTRVIGNSVDPTREITFGRGNLSFTSINLPRLAIESKQDVNTFFEKLDNQLKLVSAQLLERFEVQCRRKVKNYPFLMGQGVWIDSKNLKWDDEVREIIKHGTLSIGFIGLAETLTSLVGSHHGESADAQKVGLLIIERMRQFCDDEAARTGLNFSLLATPAEGLSGRFVRMDRKKYGAIPGVTDRDYYTNSFHVPVYYKTGALKKLEIEAPYHALTNAGHISYIELDGNPSHNLEAFEKIVHKMHELGIGYGSINHPVDRHPDCGYTGIINNECPKCKSKESEGARFERIRRITGYLVGTLDRFNDAKKSEVNDRVKHNT